MKKALFLDRKVAGLLGVAKVYLSDVLWGVTGGVVSFVIATLYSAFSRDALSSLMVFIVVAILAAIMYPRRSAYKKNHQTPSLLAIILFVLAEVLVLVVGIYILLWISFVSSSGPTVL